MFGSFKKRLNDKFSNSKTINLFHKSRIIELTEIYRRFINSQEIICLYFCIENVMLSHHPYVFVCKSSVQKSA